jgi:hypothetical protein
MNYKKIYDSIISKRQCNLVPDNVYSENHHILPRSLGGKDIKENLVRLTAREHFICHYLLVKIYKDDIINYNKMITAFQMLKLNPNSKVKNRRYVNSLLYEKNKIFYSELCKLKVGKNNTNYGYRFIKHVECKVCMKLKHIDCYEFIEQGWVFGRSMSYTNVTKTRNNLIFRNEKLKKRNITRSITDKKYLQIYNDFLKSEYKNNWALYCKSNNLNRANIWRNIATRILYP